MPVMWEVSWEVMSLFPPVLVMEEKEEAVVKPLVVIVSWVVVMVSSCSHASASTEFPLHILCMYLSTYPKREDRVCPEVKSHHP